jgi:hypothetical protein
VHAVENATAGLREDDSPVPHAGRARGGGDATRRGVSLPANVSCFPLDEQFGLGAGSLSSHDHLVQLAVWVPFRRVGAMLGRVTGVQVSEATRSEQWVRPLLVQSWMLTHRSRSSAPAPARARSHAF